MHKPVQALTFLEQVNFLLTNRIPRIWLTHFIGWYSQINSPILTKVSIAIWRCFASDLNFSEAKKSHFNSLQACFTRELKVGCRPIDNQANAVTSPCDAIVGAFGELDELTLIQAKGFPYQISELIPAEQLSSQYRNGKFVTLRLTSSMYHRFHAPIDCTVHEVNYISGDTWNVNPIALKKVQRLFCKNERAIIELHTQDNNSSITLVPVAAVLVACMKFNFLTVTLDLKYRGDNKIPCHAHFKKGDEMGYFQQGSTIILFATENYQFPPTITEGLRINMGQALLHDNRAKKLDSNICFT